MVRGKREGSSVSVITGMPGGPPMITGQLPASGSRTWSLGGSHPPQVGTGLRGKRRAELGLTKCEWKSD